MFYFAAYFVVLHSQSRSNIRGISHGKSILSMVVRAGSIRALSMPMLTPLAVPTDGGSGLTAIPNYDGWRMMAKKTQSPAQRHTMPLQ